MITLRIVLATLNAVAALYYCVKGPGWIAAINAAAFGAATASLASGPLP